MSDHLLVITDVQWGSPAWFQALAFLVTLINSVINIHKLSTPPVSCDAPLQDCAFLLHKQYTEASH